MTGTVERQGVPLTRLVRVELRKMFDTRSGFWLMVSIGIISTLATLAVIFFAPDEELSYEIFAAAIGFPMGVVLPIVAILCVTSEWSQRTGLITFTLEPHRGRVLWAKGLASILAGVVSLLIALSIGAIGNLVGSAINGIDPRWDLPVPDALLILFAHVLGLLVGFVLGVLLRSSAAAIVAYFVYGFVLPAIFGILAATQRWFADIQRWVDFNFAQSRFFNPPVGADDWAALGVSSIPWFVLPLALGIRLVLRAEVK